MRSVPPRPPLHGVMGEFSTPQDLVTAIEDVRAKGYTKLDAYSPYPIEEAWEALGHHKSPVPLVVLIGGIVGGLSGFFLQYWVSVIEYPLNVGGRPLNSWPSFIPVTFECTILGAVLGAFLIGLIQNILVFERVAPYWQTAFTGGIILLAAVVDIVRQRRSQT